MHAASRRNIIKTKPSPSKCKAPKKLKERGAQKDVIVGIEEEFGF